MKIHKEPAQYADDLLALNLGDYRQARLSLMQAVRHFKHTPITFFWDVMVALEQSEKATA